MLVPGKIPAHGQKNGEITLNAIPNEERNNQVYLKRIPTGLLGPEDFEVREASIPTPGEGEVLIQAHYLAQDAALRLIVRDSDDFLFRVEPGDLVRSTIAGEIIASNNSDFAVGDFVTGGTGAQNFSVSNGEGLEKVDVSKAPLPSWLGGLGVSGLTAYFAIFEDCKDNIGPGKTVVVNGAAGAVGTMAGQFAKIAGSRVIGITSTDEKCQWLVDEVGFDEAINYKKGDLYEQLVAAAPDRIDVVFDNVGGDIMDQSLRWIGLRGIVLMCGSTSQYTEDEMKGPANYIWLGTMRARIQGYVVFDYADRFAEARDQIAAWVADGKLKFHDYIIDGDIADFGDVFRRLYEGENKGKMLIRLPVAAQ